MVGTGSCTSLGATYFGIVMLCNKEHEENTLTSTVSTTSSIVKVSNHNMKKMHNPQLFSRILQWCHTDDSHGGYFRGALCGFVYFIYKPLIRWSSFTTLPCSSNYSHNYFFFNGSCLSNILSRQLHTYSNKQ